MKINYEYSGNIIKTKIIIANNILKNTGGIPHFRKLKGKLVLLTNNKVKNIWIPTILKSLEQANIAYHLISIPDGEKFKNFYQYQNIITRLVKLKIDRHSVLVTVGGGVISDLGGFVAATYKRGIRLIHIPTTLIAQIDASIGGKTAVDLNEGKNLVGAFYNPELILIDPTTLVTLDKKELINGLFEAIKIGIVSNGSIVRLIEKYSTLILARNNDVLFRLVNICSKEKARIVSQDPFDKNLRMILNFGHTFGHALETYGAYHKISHGCAVGVGMLLALRLSSLLGLIEENRYLNEYNLISALLKGQIPNKLRINELWQIMQNDKKSEKGEIRFILINNIGSPVIRKIKKTQFMEALKQI